MSQSMTERRTKRSLPVRWTPERWDPFGDLDQFNERMRQLLDQTFSPLGALLTPVEMGRRDVWSPTVDIEESDDAYVLEVELPGVKREDVRVEQIGDELMITGEIKQRERTGVVRRQTRRTGRFAYRVALPEAIEVSKIEAKLKEGVLTIRAPKSERAQRRQVEITA
jgi:HSP20 family protein